LPAVLRERQFAQRLKPAALSLLALRGTVETVSFKTADEIVSNHFLSIF